MYRHLIDGDPASNTLSWRWVGGLHTKGKTYLARPDNIAKYTNGRFQPEGLATVAAPLEEALFPNPVPLATASGQWPEGRYGLLVTSEDLSVDAVAPASIAIALEPVAKPGGIEGALSASFRAGALDDTVKSIEHSAHVHSLPKLAPQHVLEWCKQVNISTVAVAFAPVGPEADALYAIEQHLSEHGIALLRIRRRYDSLTWPHAGKGFFAMKEKIPGILQKLGMQATEAQ